MASQEVDNAQLGTASAGITPGSQVKPEMVNYSVYQPIDRSQNYQKEEFQVLGVSQPLLRNWFKMEENKQHVENLVYAHKEEFITKSIMLLLQEKTGAYFRPGK